MKKLITLLVVCILGIASNSQAQCPFTILTVQANTIQLTPLAAYNTPQYNIFWDFGDGSAITFPNPAHTYVNPGTYQIQQIITDSSTGVIVCNFIDQVTLTFCNINFFQDPVSPGFYNFSTTTTGSNFASWDFGDGSPTVTGDAVIHNYLIPGNYVVTMSLYDGTTLICQSSVTISYNIAPTCSFVTTQTGPNAFTFDGIVPTSNGILTWDFGDGTPPVTGTFVQKVYSSPGTYTVCMTFIDGADTCNYCSQINFGGTSGNCTFTLVPDSTNSLLYTFIGIASIPGNTIVWNFGDGGSAVGDYATHTYNVGGTYFICMNEIDAVTGGIVCSVCYNITVLPNPLCAFYSNPNPMNPLEQTFSAIGIFPGFNYLWDFGDGTVDSTSGLIINHTYSSIGVYTVCLSAYQNGVQICSTCENLIVQSSIYCQANFLQLSVGLNSYFVDQSITGSNTGTTYSWVFGDGATSNQQFPQHQFAQSGNYMNCLTISNGLCTSTFCDSMIVDTIINNPTTCNAFFIFTQTSAYQLAAVNLSSGFNLAFMWDFGDGSPISTAPYPSHQYTNTGTFPICLTVSDATGCTSTYCDSLTVDSLGNIIYRGMSAGFTLNVFSPLQITSGIKTNESNLNVDLYPNPTAEKLNVKINSNSKNLLTYKITSIEGRIIMNGALSREFNLINTKDLDAGIYLLEINAADGSQNVKRFVKQ